MYSLEMKHNGLTVCKHGMPEFVIGDEEVFFLAKCCGWNLPIALTLEQQELWKGRFIELGADQEDLGLCRNILDTKRVEIALKGCKQQVGHPHKWAVLCLLGSHIKEIQEVSTGELMLIKEYIR